jgi:hypothetical protein
MTAEPKYLSSLEMLLLGANQPETPEGTAPLRKNALCPHCGLSQLDYNGLLQLECPLCGFVSNEGGGCT